MKLNLDEIVSGTFPDWELVIAEPQGDFPTRQPTVGELGMLDVITNGQLAGEEGEKLISSLFAGTPPPVGKWLPAKRRSFAVGYLRFWAIKNYQAVAPRTLAAVAAAMETGL